MRRNRRFRLGLALVPAFAFALGGVPAIAPGTAAAAGAGLTIVGAATYDVIPDEHRATEVDVAIYTLNRMLDLGRTNYVRTA